MSALSTLHATQNLVTRLEKIGGKPPKSLAEDIAALTGLAKQVDRLDLADGLAAATLDALAAGRDIGTDPAIAAAVVRRQVNASANGLSGELANRAHELLSTHAAALFEAYRAPFDKAASTLTEAAKQLGAVDLADAKAIIAKGPDATSAWGRAQSALAVIADIRQGWETLQQTLHTGPTDPRYVVLVYADIPPAAWYDDGIAATAPSERPTPWQCAVAGYPLSLATPEVYERRRAAIYDEGARRDAHRANEGHRAQGAMLRHTA